MWGAHSTRPLSAPRGLAYRGRMLKSETSRAWLEVALAGLDRVLVDHAHCERKAAAQAMALVSAYPERELLVRRLSGLAVEELRHFRAVYAELGRRGLALSRDAGDPYARALQGLVRGVDGAQGGGSARLVDRLLVGGLIESRSCERLGLLAGGLDAGSLRDLYRSLVRAEAGHARLFVDLACAYADPDGVAIRLDELAVSESEILAALPLEPRIH